VFLTLTKLYHAVRLGSHFFRAANVALTSPRYELGKVAFSSMFLNLNQSQRFGTHLFPSFTTSGLRSHKEIWEGILDCQSHNSDIFIALGGDTGFFL